MKITVRDESEDWLQTIIEEFDAIEDRMPVMCFMGDDAWPEWVKVLCREYLKTTMPSHKWKVGKKWTPAEVATMVAYRLLYLQRLDEIASNPRFVKFVEEMAPDLREYLEKKGEYIETVILDLREASMAAVSLALIQNPTESIPFFEAFSKAFLRAPSDLGASNFLRTSTHVQYLMLREWRWVATFQSVRELHEWLCRNFETHLVGDQKRIEKMCERIGLHFGQPGRPRKNGKIKPTKQNGA